MSTYNFDDTAINGIFSAVQTLPYAGSTTAGGAATKVAATLSSENVIYNFPLTSGQSGSQNIRTSKEMRYKRDSSGNVTLTLGDGLTMTGTAFYGPYSGTISMFGSGAMQVNITAPTTASDGIARTCCLPDASGTLALTSQLLQNSATEVETLADTEYIFGLDSSGNPVKITKANFLAEILKGQTVAYVETSE